MCIHRTLIYKGSGGAKRDRGKKNRNQQGLMGKLAKEIRIQRKCPTLVSRSFVIFLLCPR